MRFLYWLRCFFGDHDFGDWVCKSNRQHGFDAEMWFERECAECGATERKDFR